MSVYTTDIVASAQRLEASGTPATEIGPALGRSREWWSRTRKRLGLPKAKRLGAARVSMRAGL